MLESKRTPLVTIGIPTYNRGALIGGTIQAALNQTYANIEILISDNASEDDTDRICRRYSDRNASVRYVRQKRNIGPTENFKYVLHHAKGEYFMWLGDDDWIDANYVEEGVKILTGREDVTIATGIPYYYRDDKFLYTGTVINLLQERGTVRLRRYYAQVRHNSGFYGLMRRALLVDHDLDNVLGGDLLIIGAMAYRGKMVSLETTRLHRRRGGESQNNAKLVRSMALSWLERYLPRTAVARNVYIHITSRDDIFGNLPKWARHKLAVECICLAFLRKAWAVCRGEKNRE